MNQSLSALIFLAINVGAGGAHYLYSLFAARSMTPEEFGEFSGWAAWVYMCLSLGALAQYGANFFPLQKRGLKICMWSALGLSAVVLILFLFGDSRNSTLIGILAIIISPFMGWLFGQTQRRLKLMSFALSGFFAAATKITLVFLPAVFLLNLGLAYAQRDLFYWALPLSYVTGILAVSLVLWRELRLSPKAHPGVENQVRVRLIGAGILSFSSVFIPNIDLSYVSKVLGAEILTPFAQVSLFYKVVFFVILIFSNWLLPQQLNSREEATNSGGKMKIFARICVMGLLFSLCASVVSAQFFKVVLNKELQAPVLWVFLSCFNVSLLTGIFLEVQNQVSKLKVGDAFAALLIQVLSVAICAVLKVDLVLYLQVQIAVNAMLLFLLFLGAGGIFARQVVD